MKTFPLTNAEITLLTDLLNLDLGALGLSERRQKLAHTLWVKLDGNAEREVAGPARDIAPREINATTFAEIRDHNPFTPVYRHCDK
jgi:hypothetical protein